jgi:DnaK suppressor protein
MLGIPSLHIPQRWACPATGPPLAFAVPSSIITWLEGTLNDVKARKLVAAERSRVEAALEAMADNLADEGSLQRQQTGENADAGSDLQSQALDMALATDLRAQLKAVERAEERIAEGTYGVSVESGAVIPDARLEVAPLAERTVQEQAAFEAGQR